MDKPRTRLFWGLGAIALLIAILGWWQLAERDAPGRADANDPRLAITPSTDAPDLRDASPLGLRGATKAAISGTIRDPAGNPIADAQVCALPNGEELLGLHDHVHACVRSGANGRYRIDDLFPVQTSVAASAPTYKPARWEQRRKTGLFRNWVQLAPGQTSKDIDITLEPGGVVIRGVIKDIAGGEIEGAQVTVDGNWASRRQGPAIGTSDEQGQFELWVAPGDAYVSAFAAGYAQGGVSSVAPGVFVELFLTPESVLIGKVVLASTGEGVEGVTVDANFGFGAAHGAMTDAEGRFRINQLQPGVYKPTARSDQLFGELAEQVHLGLGETSEPVVIRVHPAARIDGDVVFAGTKQPCPLGSVRLVSDAGVSEHESLDDLGHVIFRGVLPGQYAVSVTCVGGIADEDYPKLTVGEGPTDAQIWEVSEGLAIRGEVVDEAGAGIESISIGAAPVVAADAVREQVTRGNGRSETAGRFELAGLLPGVYEIRVQAWEGRQGPTEPITVELAGADINDIQIVMPSVGRIRGRIVDEHGAPVANTSIVAATVGSNGRNQTRSNDLGEFELEDLRPGPNRVTAVGSDGRNALRKPGTTDDDEQGEVVEVIANEVVEVVLTVESRDSRITGTVTDEDGGPVADAFVHAARMSDKAGANAAAARSMVRWGWGSQPVLTDQDGRFELDHLSDGSYLVRANRKGGGEAIAEGVAAGSGVQLVIASTGELAGTVKLADGTAPERFTLVVQDKTGGFAQRDSFFRTDGIWRLRELPAGSYEITASSAAGTAGLDAPLTLAEGEQREGIELVLDSRLTVRGRLVDLETRAGVAGLSVYVSATGDYNVAARDSAHLNVSDVDGRFVIEDAPSGRVWIRAWNQSDSKSKYDRMSRAMTLAPQPSAQDLGEIEVVARRLEPDQKPGDLGYRIQDRDPTLDPENYTPTIVAVRPGGPADAAGLAVGDVIEKVAGHAVLGDEGRYSQLTRVPEGSTLQLELREGKAVQIVVGPPLR